MPPKAHKEAEPMDVDDSDISEDEEGRKCILISNHRFIIYRAKTEKIQRNVCVHKKKKTFNEPNEILTSICNVLNFIYRTFLCH